MTSLLTSFVLTARMLFLPRGSEWIIIALVILLLFGGKKIPELMRGLGKGIRSFKDGMDEAKKSLDDDKPGSDNANNADADKPKAE